MADYHEGNPGGLKDEILRVYEDICDAFATLDYAAVLEHFADQGMVKISQGQLIRGKKDLAENWRQRVGNVAQLRIRMENVEVHRIDDNHTWSTADEYISVDGQERQAIVSNIFMLQASGWKILLDHTSYIEKDD